MGSTFVLDLPPRVEVREVVLREGLQDEQPISLNAKLAIVEALVATGIRRIQVTSFVSAHTFPALADAEQLAAELTQWEGIDFSAFATTGHGVRRAIDAGLRQIDYIVSATDSHGMANAQSTTATALAAVEGIAQLTRAVAGQLEVTVAVAWDCPYEGRTPVSRTVEVVRQAVHAGADRVCLADTIGTASPTRVVELLDAVRLACPGIELGVHLHDTRGLGLVNALTAIQSGVRHVDAAVGGLGGSPLHPDGAGLIATEELLYLLSESDVETGIDLDPLLQVGRLVEAAVRHDLPSSVYRVGGRSHPRPRRLEILSAG